MRIEKWPQDFITGAKRANIEHNDPTWDWFTGHGKDHSCQFEGSWWDMICFARNVLASANTKLAAPEFYKPEWAIDHYTEPGPYVFGERE